MPKLSKDLAKKVKGESGKDPFAPLDEGYHRVKLVKVTTSTSQSSGNPMWCWEFKSVEPQEGKDLREYTVLHENALWKLAQVFEAFGVEPTTPTDTLLGKTILVEVGQEVQQQGKGKGRTRHTIVGYPDQNLSPRLFNDSAPSEHAPDTNTGPPPTRELSNEPPF